MRIELSRDPVSVADDLTEQLLAHRSVKAVVGVGTDPENWTGTERDEIRRRVGTYVASSAQVVKRLSKTDDRGEISGNELASIESIVLLMLRPAILVQDGQFFPAPKPWTAELESKRSDIESVLSRVGRIEVNGHPDLDWVGTGWLAGDGVIMTNRHVAVEFARSNGKGGWTFLSGMRARIDFNEEFNASSPREFAIRRVIGVHPKHDVALLAVSKSGMSALEPLPVASEPDLKKGDHVYVVGYPHRDSRRNGAAEMDEIFNHIYDVKRLQPGEIKTVPRTRTEFVHDCSTLGGNSGSCVVSLATGRVVGLHFGGKYLKWNKALALWQLRKEPMLTKAGVNFI